MTEDMLKEKIYVNITETDCITVLDVPSTSLSVDSDETPGVLWVGFTHRSRKVENDSWNAYDAIYLVYINLFSDVASKIKIYNW